MGCKYLLVLASIFNFFLGALMEKSSSFQGQVSGDSSVIPPHRGLPISLCDFSSINVRLKLEPGISSPTPVPVQIPI